MVRDQAAFRAAFGSSAAVLGDATVTLDGDGPHVIRLERPPGRRHVGDARQRRLHRSAPWPAAASQGGASLQLIDATRDNRRVAWAARSGATTNPPVNVVSMTNAWRYKQDGPAPADWRNPGFNDAAWPSGRALLVVEDASLAAPKNTQLTRTDGRITYYFRTRFTFTGNPEGASLALNTFVDDGFALHLNGREIHRLGLDPAATLADTLAANRTVADAALEGPFVIPVTNLLSGENVLAVEVHQVNTTSSDIVWGASVDVLEVKRDPATPGYADSVRANLPAFPDVWLNEVQPRNTAGPLDNFGDQRSLIELAQTGSATASLDGLWLSDDPAQPGNGRFPPVPRSPGANSASSGPTAKRPERAAGLARLLGPGFPDGVILLSGQLDGVPAVLDYLRYSGAAENDAFGSRVESDPTGRGRLAAATPGTAREDSRRRPTGRRPSNRSPTPAPPRLNRSKLPCTPPTLTPASTSPTNWSAPPPEPPVDPSSGRIAWTPETSRSAAMSSSSASSTTAFRRSTRGRVSW